MCMPKTVHRHTIHLTDEQEAIVTRLQPQYKSLNALIVHCLEVVGGLEPGTAEVCTDQQLGVAVRKVITMAGDGGAGAPHSGGN